MFRYYISDHIRSHQVLTSYPSFLTRNCVPLLSTCVPPLKGRSKGPTASCAFASFTGPFQPQLKLPQQGLSPPGCSNILRWEEVDQPAVDDKGLSRLN